MRIFFKDFIYSLEPERYRERREREKGERKRTREKQPPLRKEPDMGLDPRTLGSGPEPKADA